MGCESCKDNSKGRKVILPEGEVVNSYNEFDDGAITVKYTGDSLLRIRGCKSRHLFLFNPDSEREVDLNDAHCFAEREDFEIVTFQDGETEIEPEEVSTEREEEYEPIHENDEEGF